ncbi:M20 aminoacylase family protein [Agrobacterium rubi]|uniref:Amidohydrolase n=1 Tax=Agrobacterium rubi TaxID=28099 RepID=A0AAE7R5T8_9HYPH|nr:M20 aminoacylase family protein [Agrobacterium rubi]NTE87750.1 amidohydrolase [Agrobacterium rubi]NTF05251.1 amidohydrolase [Agrobacterium rubi]NTF37844.1 amidohydrolase [Agrobacterium rubi]OCJ54101.1 amidohydrolase [Agrobacterium rubi]QTG01709.1 amidohydrolase [Agrobacterium rubi]
MSIIDHITGLLPDLIAIRHDLHANPEIGFEEERTSDVVATHLQAMGVEVHRGIGKTGVVGLLKNGEGPTIALRSDMDALPMQELTDLPYRSRHDNRFHGCGHDGHMTMLLGAARYLSETRNFSGTVMFVFQPAEEGLGGSRAMIADGLFERFPCDEIYALHNAPHHPKGTVAISRGPAMAGADFFDIRIKGRGGHAALPDTTIDPIIAMNTLIQSLQTIVSRNISPISSAVISVTKIVAGSAYNVIPDVVEFGGTIRALDEGTRVLIREKMRQASKGCEELYAVEINVDIRNVFSVLSNHPAQTQAVVDIASSLLGESEVAADCPPFMASEDFADMLNIVPGAYFFIGQENTAPLHNPSYEFDDDIIPVGAALLASIVQTRSASLR